MHNSLDNIFITVFSRNYYISKICILPIAKQTFILVYSKFIEENLYICMIKILNYFTCYELLISVQKVTLLNCSSISILKLYSKIKGIYFESPLCIVFTNISFTLSEEYTSLYLFPIDAPPRPPSPGKELLRPDDFYSPRSPRSPHPPHSPLGDGYLSDHGRMDPHGQRRHDE